MHAAHVIPGQLAAGPSRAAQTDMRTRSLVPALAIASLLVGCSSSAPTRLELSVTAGPGVEPRAAAVRLRVLGGRAPDATDYVETRPMADLGWPVEATIVPRGGDASRPIWIEVEALSAIGETIARNARSAGFVPGTTQIVRLHLACTTGCVDPSIDAHDAGFATSGSRDGGAPARDGGAPDGGACSRAESCDGARDEDCDGMVDEGCECTDEARRACPRGSDEGACATGAETCAEGRWGACVGAVEPTSETCNALDDDCDGDTDEDLSRRCDGRDCAQTCADGEWGRCVDRRGACEEDD